MKTDDLARLYWIRKQREEKALKVMMERQGALQHAEAAAAKAARASAEQANDARERERGSLVALVGRELRRHDLLNLQSSLDADADDQQRLRAAEREAAERRDARQGELQAARTVFRRHHREAEKLAQIVKKRDVEAARKRLTYAEANEDELHGRAIPQLPFPSRSENA